MTFSYAVLLLYGVMEDIMQASSQYIPTRYYYLAMVSAILVGVNCFVVALNFMLSCQIHISLALACATAGLALNTALFCYGGAQKLANFFASLPGSLYHRNTLIALSSGLCMGALTYDSYLGHFAHMNDYWRMVLPFYPIAITFSLANMLSNFILFYQDDADQAVTTQKPATVYYAVASSFVQSTAYTLLNYTCVYSLFNIVFPGYITTNTILSAGLALGLMLGEYRFNHDIIQATQSASPTHRLLNSSSLIERCQHFAIWSAILLNGFANGWIALGYLEINSLLLKLAIIANGTFVSVAVMKSSVDNTFASIYSPSTSADAPLVPKNKSQQQQLSSWLKYTCMGLVVAYGSLWPNAYMISPLLPLLSYTAGIIMLSQGLYRYACARRTQKLLSVPKVPSNKVASNSFASSAYRLLMRFTQTNSACTASRKPTIRDR